MFKEWLKEFLAVLLCSITLLYSMPTTVFADDTNAYVKDDSSDSFTYYIVDGKSVSKLFDFGISDAINGVKAVNWLLNFRSFTVIKEFTNDEGKNEYKVYFNTPNLQSIVKNQVISAINDGYTDSTYDVNETEWLVDVGPDADKENAITKYGFAIPNYTYMGEYPKEIMSVAHILPTNFWEGLWRAILSIFGVSFIKAPDASNFNTITYLNHQYNDSSDLILTLFQNYYIPYFVNYINTANYSSPEDLIAATVTKEENDAAEEYTKAHKDEYNKLKEKYDIWKKLTDDNEQMIGSQVNTLGYSYWRNAFEVSEGIVGDKYTSVNGVDTITKINGESIEDWISSEDNGRQERFANLVKEWKTNNSSYNANAVIYLLACAYYSKTSFSSSDEDIVKMWYGASAVDTNSSAASKITVKPSSSSKNSITLDKLIKDYYNYEDDAMVEDKDEAKDKDGKYPKKYLYEIYGGSSILSYNGKSVTLSDYMYFVRHMSLFGGFDGLQLSDFLTEDELLLYDTYNKKLDVQDKYDAFVDNFGKDEKEISSSNSTIGYSQCLIASEDDDKCESKAEDGEEPTSISIASLYAYSGLYRLTEPIIAEGRSTLTSSEAMQVIAKIQTYCGPFYNEVLSNLITIMVTIAINNGDTTIYKAIMEDDPRVMPFDTSQLPAEDSANYDVIDPRVELYKSHIIGGLVSNFTINFGFGIFIKPQQLLVNFGGKITEVSVFLQQMCNFDKLDDLGLSPTKMWQSAFITLLLACLALFFIIKTIVSIIKMGVRSMPKLITGFIILVLELGIVTAFAVNPEGMWTNIKTIETTLMSLGEKSSAVANSPNTKYLFGDSTDTEVLYYMPYLDLWSKYNTGYGIDTSEQLMDSTRDEADLKGYKSDSVQIGSSDVKHYSVLLADAFSYYGDTISVTNFVQENGNFYNGSTINNNAYRVVDHFLAPRVTVTKLDDGNLNMSVTDNENYNGQFQGGFVDLICKLLNCILMCLLSIIKFFTFLWQWFMLYVLIFKIILGKGAEGKNWGIILLETFSPTFAIILIGLYASVILQLGMIAEGFIGILLELGLFWLTFLLIRWWKHIKHGAFFPNSLGWLYILTNLKQKRRENHTEQLRQESANNAKDSGIDMTDEELTNLDKRTEKLFNSDGTFKSEYNNDKYRKNYEDWYKFAKNSKNLGRELTQQEQLAMRQFENDDRFSGYANAVNKYGTGKHLNKKLNGKRTKNMPTATSTNSNNNTNNTNNDNNDTTQDNSAIDKWSRISNDDDK